MKTAFRRFWAFILLLAFYSPASSVFATDKNNEYISKDTFYNWISGDNQIVRNVVGYLTGKVCTVSEDGYHHATSYASSRDDGYYRCICTYCGKEFTAYASDLQQSYETQVDEIQNQYGAVEFGANGYVMPVPISSFIARPLARIDESSPGYPFYVSFYSSSRDSKGYFFLDTGRTFVAPVSGKYSLYYDLTFVNVSLANGPEKGVSSFRRDYLKGDNIILRYTTSGDFSGSVVDFAQISDAPGFGSIAGRIYFLVEPANYSVNNYLADIGGINSRPTSITGNYGIIGDNGQITQVTDNSSIVNETTNQFFNPATGESATISDWTYNYEDRSYTVTTETGDTVTVTYGDENITIVQGGDTYNIYYMVPGGSGTPGPDSCAHNWQETDKTEPTCVTAGKTVSTCSLCGKTKTDPLPATGHIWVVERTVQTSYDDEGNLLQQGYTIYQCSVCGEQYKDQQGTGPPGEEEEKSLWEQLGDLIGSGIGGILELAGAILGKILDALTSLVEMITDKLKGIVEGILAIFDELPALFGGFLDFLGALFPYLPEEIMTLLTFGVIAIVFIGILKAVRR